MQSSIPFLFLRRKVYHCLIKVAKFVAASISGALNLNSLTLPTYEADDGEPIEVCRSILLLRNMVFVRTVPLYRASQWPVVGGQSFEDGTARHGTGTLPVAS